MGEAWSDWYAMDYLVEPGPADATAADKADIVLFQYDGAGVAVDRTEPIDCKVGVDRSRLCTGGDDRPPRAATPTPTTARSIGGPEVHADGEIWAQTLWDLRDQARLAASTESLVTRAMELSPYNPSFLDMRNAILLADTATFGGTHHGRDLEGVRAPRHGLLRRLARRRRRHAREPTSACRRPTCDRA